MSVVYPNQHVLYRDGIDPEPNAWVPAWVTLTHENWTERLYNCISTRGYGIPDTPLVEGEVILAFFGLISANGDLFYARASEGLDPGDFMVIPGS